MDRFCNYVLIEVKKVVGSLSPQVQISNACFASKVVKVSSFAVIVLAGEKIRQVICRERFSKGKSNIPEPWSPW